MRRLSLLAILACALSVVPSAGAILGGKPDGDEHPYVAFVGDPVTRQSCTAVLISPTVAVTAAHCFAPSATVLVFPYADGPAGGPPTVGTFHPHPDFCKPPACTGDPSDPAFFVTDDVAVVKLSQPVALSRYAELPKIEKSQGKGKVQKYVGKDVSLLGYGVQAFVPFPVSDFTRTIAQEELSQPIPVAADKFVQIDQQAAGFCLGDSGGPVLEKKKDVVLAISSSNSDVETCLGPALAYRLDSEAAQGFINAVG
jgi:Trypsin